MLIVYLCLLLIVTDTLFVVLDKCLIAYGSTRIAEKYIDILSGLIKHIGIDLVQPVYVLDGGDTYSQRVPASSSTFSFKSNTRRDYSPILLRLLVQRASPSFF